MGTNHKPFIRVVLIFWNYHWNLTSLKPIFSMENNTLKAKFQAYREVHIWHTQKDTFFLDEHFVRLVSLLQLNLWSLFSNQFFPTGNSEDSPADWVPHGPDWRRMSPGLSQHKKSSIIISRCFTEFYFYQRLGHLTLVTLYETVPHIVVKDPQWFAHLFVFYFVKNERQLLVTWLDNQESDYKIRWYCLQIYE